MLVDSNYEKYAQLCPKQYEFAMTCTFGQAKEAINDSYCPSWAKELLKERFRSAFAIQRADDEKKRVAKMNFLKEHPNADICIVNLALAIYKENDKKMSCDKISLNTAIDEAFDLYNKHFN